jgi:serine/threonine protein kinase
LATFRHKDKHVVEIYDFACSKGIIYMMLEYINGGNLLDVIDKTIMNLSQTTEAEAKNLFRGILKGLKVLHDS